MIYHISSTIEIVKSFKDVVPFNLECSIKFQLLKCALLVSRIYNDATTVQQSIYSWYHNLIRLKYESYQ